MKFKIEIFNHSEYRIHKAYIFSKATIFNTIIILFAIILPLLFLSGSRDFWVTETEKYYRPNVNFKNQLVVTLLFKDSIKIWTNIGKLKTSLINQNKFVNCQSNYKMLQTFTTGIVVGEKINEAVDINLSCSTEEGTIIKSVHGVQFLTVFNYSLTEDFNFQTEGIASTNVIYSNQGNNLKIFGKLKMKQRQPLPTSGSWSDSKIKFLDRVDNIAGFMKEYLKRNYTVLLDDSTLRVSWYPVVFSPPKLFEINARIRFEPQFFRAGNSLPYALKYAWLQYVAVFFVSYLISERLRYYIFDNQLFSTIIQYPKIVN